MHAFLSHLIHPTRTSQNVYLVRINTACHPVPWMSYLRWLEILASTNLEELKATDPKFDDVKILARSEQGELITIPIKVSIMNKYFQSHIAVLIEKLSANWLFDKIWGHSHRTRSLCSWPGHSLIEKSCFYIWMISFANCSVICWIRVPGLNLSLGTLQLKCNFYFDSGPVICRTGVIKTLPSTRTCSTRMPDNSKILPIIMEK